MAGQKSSGSGGGTGGGTGGGSGLKGGGTAITPKGKKPKPPLDPGRQTPTDGFGNRPQGQETPTPTTPTSPETPEPTSPTAGN